jgi:Flp pilus assembly protein TadD
MKTAKLVAVTLAIVPAMLASTYATDAGACGMSIRMEPSPQKPTPVQEIARAEKALEGGQNLVAAKAVLATFPRVRAATAGANPLETRALRVFALAVVRSNGALNEKSAGLGAQAEWTPNANLEWAVQSLREIDAKRPNDPTVQADLGEALSKLPRGQGEALTILQGLAQKDLMGSPHAYAALAKLRSEKGDLAGAEAAIKRCEEMSKSPGVCKPAVPSKPASPSVVAAKV